MRGAAITSRTTVPATMALAGSILLFLWASPALASPGDLDPSFGASGKVTTLIGRGADVAYGVAIQADGKVVAAGTAHLKATRRDFALARYDASGTLDPTFGQGGIVTTDFAGGDDIGYALAIQADGKIVLAGSAFLGGGS